MKLAHAVLFGAAVALAGMSTPALASDAAKCSVHSGQYSAMRAVQGGILAHVRDWLGISHIVVQDDSTGCKVYVLAQNTDACNVGQRFEGTGRLRTDFSGESYDATLSLGRDKGSCR